MMKRTEKGKVVVLAIFLSLVVYYVYTLKVQISELEEPKIITGTYQLQPHNTPMYDKLPVEVFVITQENILYVYKQFEPLLKTELKYHSDGIFSFQWNGTEFIKIDKNKLYYFDAKNNKVYTVPKIDNVPTFINVFAEDFDKLD